MAALIVPNAAQMRLIWAQGGVLYALNVLGVHIPGATAITQALANTIGTAVKAAFASTSYNSMMGPTITLVNIGIRDIRTANQPEFIDSGAVVTGTAVGDLLPPQTALVITLRTALAGRNYRGRVYLCGFTEAINSSTGAATGATTAVNFVAAVKAALVASSLDLGVISRPDDTKVPPKVGWVTPVTAMVARDLVWDTQRRRAIPGI